MKPRKTKEIQKVLEKKGFVREPEIDHHQFYCLLIDGKKQAIKPILVTARKNTINSLWVKLKSN